MGPSHNWAVQLGGVPLTHSSRRPLVDIHRISDYTYEHEWVPFRLDQAIEHGSAACSKWQSCHVWPLYVRGNAINDFNNDTLTS